MVLSRSVRRHRAIKFLQEEARPAPLHFQGLAVEVLEVLQFKLRRTLFQRDCVRLRIVATVHAVVIDNDLAIEQQARAVIGIEREQILAIGRHE